MYCLALHACGSVKLPAVDGRPMHTYASGVRVTAAMQVPLRWHYLAITHTTLSLARCALPASRCTRIGLNHTGRHIYLK